MGVVAVNLRQYKERILPLRLALYTVSSVLTYALKYTLECLLLDSLKPTFSILQPL